MDQLNKLKSELMNSKPPVPLSVNIKQILTSKVFLIGLLLIVVGFATYSTWKTISLLSSPSFTKADRIISLSHFRKTAEHTGQDYVRGSVRLDSMYATDVHHVRLSIENLSPSLDSFIGIINEQSGSAPFYGWLIEGDVAFNPNAKESLFPRISRE